MALMCGVLDVSRSGFYKWRARSASKRSVANDSLLDYLLKTALQEHGVPGYRKLWKAATDAGFICSKNRVQRLLQGIGYRSRVALKPGYRKPVVGMLVAPNLLNREFSIKDKNRVWVSDITQLRCKEGWLYVATVLDLFSRAIVGWATSCINNAELVHAAIKSAWSKRQPDGAKLMFHSDQGVQYRSEQVLSWLTKKKVTISMSRRGNCWDNACAESFFALMKKEWFNPLGKLTRDEACVEVQYYIDEYYNRVRRHGTLQGVSPMNYEKQVNQRCLL